MYDSCSMDKARATRFALITFLLIQLPSGYAEAPRPHVVFIVADDLGWNDVGWHNAKMITPNLDRLARDGVILDSSYVQPVCSPQLSEWKTVSIWFNKGVQHDVIDTAGKHGKIEPSSPDGMPLWISTLPQKLKEVGYATHMVGKWHLGFCNWAYTPTFRGFDSFLGYLTGAEDYYTHSRVDGYDLRFNQRVHTEPNGTYSSYVFRQRAVDVINSHSPTQQPLFMYLPFQSVHGPLEVPKKYEDLYVHIKNRERRIFSGMVTALDEAVGEIVSALEKNGFMNNTLVIFTTDNGGLVKKGADNMPLRGGKNTLWEGGTKGSAFVYSETLFKMKGYVNTEMIHAVDWLPTILHLAGGTPDPYIDGVNQWLALSEGFPSNRTEFVYNIDDIRDNAAIRVRDYKLIKGDAGEHNDWYSLPSADQEGLFYNNDSSQAFGGTYRLYNIKHDPTEHYDLTGKHPEVLSMMKQKLETFRMTMVPAQNSPPDPRSDPSNFGGVWSPGWC